MTNQQRALEKSVLQAARRLRGSIVKRGLHYVPSVTWACFEFACDRLNDYHAERQRKRRGYVSRPLEGK